MLIENIIANKPLQSKKKTENFTEIPKALFYFFTISILINLQRLKTFSFSEQRSLATISICLSAGGW